MVGGGLQLGGADADQLVTYYSWAWDDLGKRRAHAKWPSGVFPQSWQLVAVAICANAA